MDVGEVGASKSQHRTTINHRMLSCSMNKRMYNCGMCKKRVYGERAIALEIELINVRLTKETKREEKKEGILSTFIANIKRCMLVNDLIFREFLAIE